MTYAELLLILSNLSDEQLRDTATVYSKADTEYMPIIGIGKAMADDVLHKGHITLVVEG